jgi:CHAT domain-containing protein
MSAAERARAAFQRARELQKGGDEIGAAGEYLTAADEFEVSREPEWHAAALWEAGLGFMNAGQPRQALAPLRQAVSVLRELAESRDAKARRDLSRVLTSLGRALAAVGDPDAAIDVFAESTRLANDDERLYAWTALIVGAFYRNLKRPQEAKGYLIDAHEVFERLGDQRRTASAANNLGTVFNDLDDHEEALRYFSVARVAYLELKDKIMVATMDVNIARQHLMLGDSRTGEETVDAALDVLAGPEHWNVRAEGLTTKHKLLWAREQTEAALTPLREAAAIYEREGQVSDHAAVLGTLAGRLMDMDEFDEGLRLLEQGVQELEGAHDALRGQAMRAFYLDRINGAYSALVASYIHADRPVDALLAAERAKGRTLAGLLRAAAARQGEPDGQSVAAVRQEVVSVQQELGQVHEAMSQLPADCPPEQLVALQRSERELQISLSSIEATLGASLSRTAAISAVSLSSPQEPGELLLHYTLASAQSYLIARLGDVVRAHVLPSIAELEPNIRTLRDDLRRGLAPRYARSLYVTLLAPVQQLIDSADRLLIVPDGALLDLPFSVLLSANLEPQTGLRRWRDYPWLVLSHTVRYAPSLAVAAALAARRDERAGVGGQLAAVAAPLIDPDSELAATLPADATRAAAAAGAPLSPLRFVFKETVDVCRRLGFRGEIEAPAAVDSDNFAIRTHSAATKQAVIELARSGTFRYWHFACHGLVDLALTDHSGLVFSPDEAQGDPYWRAYEVVGVPLSCELATLSACDTGLGRKLRGEGVFGLARAFMTAGADTLCVSMWPVVDSSAASLMADFYGALADGEDKASALAHAQKAAIAADLHPRHWGPFTLIGGR